MFFVFSLHDPQTLEVDPPQSCEDERVKQPLIQSDVRRALLQRLAPRATERRSHHADSQPRQDAPWVRLLCRTWPTLILLLVIDGV